MHDAGDAGGVVYGLRGGERSACRGVGVGLVVSSVLLLVFFFQAEDGIRDIGVTGVQTCALPISRWSSWPRSTALPCPSARRSPTPRRPAPAREWSSSCATTAPARCPSTTTTSTSKIGRASCRERV